MLTFKEKMDKFNYIKFIGERAECTVGSIYPIYEKHYGGREISFIDDDYEHDMLCEAREKDVFIFVTNKFANKNGHLLIDNQDEYEGN